MKKITVIVQAPKHSSDFRDARLVFWDAFRRQSRAFSELQDVEDFADQYEASLKRRLPSALHRRLSAALLGSRTPEIVEVLPRSSVTSGRLIVSVEDIRYGSMKVELGIADIDAFIELLGNNSETFEAVFGAYVPQAFDDCLLGDMGGLDYQIDIPTDVQNYIKNSSVNEKTAKSNGSAKERGTAILINLIQSPLVLPIILICFLWYYARQDMVEERRVTYGLIQTLVTEQTAVISLLKDRQSDQSKDREPTTHSASNVETQQISKPKTDKKAK